MPFNGSGTFSIINTFVPNSTILSSAVNSNNTDIASGLSDCLTRDGQAGMTAALSMGSHLINNVTDPVSAQDAATKNYVDTKDLAVWSTGDVKLTYKSVADSGWVMFQDGTIGDASSGATVASATTAALFTLMYNSPFNDTSCPIYTSTAIPTTRAVQGTAAAAYAAHCRLATPVSLGRAMALAGAGAGLTFRAVGSTIGQETVILGTGNLPPYTPSGTVFSTSTATNIGQGNLITVAPLGGGANVKVFDTSAGTGGVDSNGALTGTAQGGTSTPFTNMPPETFLNAMVKL